MEYDEIIVGGGSSGAVLAARLSEDGRRKVLLIEAGADYPDIESTPNSVLNGHQMPTDHDWGFIAEMVPGRSVAYPRGKVMGGCSSVNACLALRGTPADYDEWAALGNADWDWAKVLPVFVRIENDQDARGELHGLDGPTPVRRYAHDELWPVQRAFVEACQELGFPKAHDHNHPEATGVGYGPWNLRSDGVRMSTAITYLLSARGRSNLTIRPGCLVNRVLLDGQRAIGVDLESGGDRKSVFGGRVTLSGGAIGSPTILLRSGIGPPDDLRAIGIEPTIPLAGVGMNLIDHAQCGLSWNLAPGMVDETTPLVQTLLRYTAPGSSRDNDMQIMSLQRLLQPGLLLRTLLMKPESRGALRLVSTDANVQPDIRINLASTAEDVRRLGEGLKLLGALIGTSHLTGVGAHTIVLEDGDTMSATQFAGLLGQSNWIEGYIQRVVRHYVHPVGTARMGLARDPGAVVDQHGRVHGITALRVADASIMPTIPRANTHLTCVMIGERVAGWMREQDG